jgi:hypothetical protein
MPAMASIQFNAIGDDRIVRAVEDVDVAEENGAAVAATEVMAVVVAEDAEEIAEEIAEEPLSEDLVATSRRASASRFVGKFRSHASLHTPWR